MCIFCVQVFQPVFTHPFTHSLICTRMLTYTPITLDHMSVVRSAADECILLLAGILILSAWAGDRGVGNKTREGEREAGSDWLSKDE